MPRRLLLRVAEAKPRDRLRWMARIDLILLWRIGADPGDIVAIRGGRLTAAVAFSSYPEDSGLDIVRLDDMVRLNAGVELGDTVLVWRINPPVARRVVLAPIGFSFEPDEGFRNYVKRRMLGKPVAEGDRVFIPVLGMITRFGVVRTEPEGIVVVSDGTVVSLLSSPAETFGLTL